LFGILNNFDEIIDILVLLFLLVLFMLEELFSVHGCEVWFIGGGVREIGEGVGLGLFFLEVGIVLFF
jgi:hypothetical protein